MVTKGQQHPHNYYALILPMLFKNKLANLMPSDDLDSIK